MKRLEKLPSRKQGAAIPSGGGPHLLIHPSALLINWMIATRRSLRRKNKYISNEMATTKKNRNA